MIAGDTDPYFNTKTPLHEIALIAQPLPEISDRKVHVVSMMYVRTPFKPSNYAFLFSLN